MPAGCTHNSGPRITFCMLVVSVIKGSKATACAHLLPTSALRVGCRRINKTGLLLIGETTKVFAIRIPSNKVCVAWTQFWILLIARDLPLFEPKAGVDAKRLIVEEPRTAYP